MEREFIAPCNPRWTSALAHLEHDIYDLPPYAEICALHENARPVAFYAADRGRFCLIPLLLRSLPKSLSAPEHWTDATSPYGYSSALFRGELDWARAALDAFVDVCQDNHIVSVFIRLNPLIPVPAEIRSSLGVQITHGSTIAVDLKLHEEEIGRRLRGSHRREIARLLRSNFTAAVDHWPDYAQFVALYQETMDRLNASGYYRFAPEYFMHLKSALGGHLHLVSVYAPDGALAAAGLFTEVDGIVQYHLSGSSAAYANLAPTKLLVNVAVRWAKQENHRVLHLGGGVGGREDALFRFKSGFSKTTLPFETWRIVTDAGKYSELVTTASRMGPDVADFFPEYRAPLLADCEEDIELIK